VAAQKAFAPPTYWPPTAILTFRACGRTDSITTLERADRYKTLVIPPEQVEAMTQGASRSSCGRRPTTTRRRATACSTARIWLQGRGYNAFWIDPGTRFGVVKGETRTSWIIDPPNGKDPVVGASWRKLAAAGR
jgi:hypothetical protein